MSKLAEKIKRASRVEAAPLGFGAATDWRAPPTLLCLLQLDKDQAGKIGDAAAAGADAVIITGMDAGSLKGVLKKLGDVPVGLRLGTAEQAAVASAREAGAGFVLMDEQSSAEVVLEERVGFVIGVSADVVDAELRVLAGLPLDALEVPAVREPFTLRRLMQVRRLSMLSQTPLVMEVPVDIGPSHLEVLRQAGAVGLVIDGKSAGKLAVLREAVLSLPPRGRRREDRAEALLPSLTGVASEEVEEEPEYE